jgi:hypothetical protein
MFGAFISSIQTSISFCNPHSATIINALRYKADRSFCNPHSATIINALRYKADRSFCNLHSSHVHHLAHNAQRNCDHGTSLNSIPPTQNAEMWFFVLQLQVCLSTSWKESSLRVQILSWSCSTMIVIASLKFVSFLLPINYILEIYPLLSPSVTKWIMDHVLFNTLHFSLECWSLEVQYSCHASHTK